MLHFGESALVSTAKIIPIQTVRPLLLHHHHRRHQANYSLDNCFAEKDWLERDGYVKACSVWFAFGEVATFQDHHQVFLVLHVSQQVFFAAVVGIYRSPYYLSEYYCRRHRLPLRDRFHSE